MAFKASFHDALALTFGSRLDSPICLLWSTEHFFCVSGYTRLTPICSILVLVHPVVIPFSIQSAHKIRTELSYIAST